MKQQIENLVRKEKERINASEKEKRDNHLISLGLIDEGKTIRRYSYHKFDKSKYDEDKKKYYIETLGALDVTDEEYFEICKYFPTVDEKVEVKVSFERSGVKTLDGFGTFFFIIASIAALFTIIGLIMCIANDMDYFSERNAIIGISASSFLLIAIGSFAGGAICKGLSSISRTALYTRSLLEKQHQFVE